MGDRLTSKDIYTGKTFQSDWLHSAHDLFRVQLPFSVCINDLPKTSTPFSAVILIAFGCQFLIRKHILCILNRNCDMEM